jgi:hypothetical protein
MVNYVIVCKKCIMLLDIKLYYLFKFDVFIYENMWNNISRISYVYVVI